ncbi:hypothetical protein IFM89_007468 [Coptis chinensis]|uniref:Uncharacterized protein n=1 Tax=Coptis chinensis TaxID=261450 RepID=A0A835H9E9_9MAGN|nr:hypothetical protein IFM89_007468 [Coptis chinensis]
MEMPKKKQVLLFYCVESEDLARKIATLSDSIQLQSINWRSFDDGFPNLFINNAQDIRGRHVAFWLPSVHHVSSLNNCLSYLPSQGYLLLPLHWYCHSFQLALLSMEEEGDVATRVGFTAMMLERFYFGDHVLPCFETGIPLLKQRLHQLPDADNISIAFPDDGAWKRFYKQLQHFPMVVCTKVREDDLVQSGGTLIECQKVLAAHGATKVSAYVTHGVFPKQSWERFLHKTKRDPRRHLLIFGSQIPVPVQPKP